MYLIIFYPLTLFLYVNLGLRFIYSLPGFVYFNFCKRGISRRARRGEGGLVVYV